MLVKDKGVKETDTCSCYNGIGVWETDIADTMV